MGTQPVQIDDRPRSKILRTSQCRLHTPNLKTKLTRSDATDVRQRAPTLRESDADRRATSSAKSQDQGCPPKGEDWGCTTKGAGRGEPADDRVRLSKEWKRI